MRVREVVAASALILTCSMTVGADPITVTFAGKVTSVDNVAAIVGFPIVPGQPYSGAFTYDPSRPSEPFLGEDDRVTQFSGKPYGMSLMVGAEAGRIDNLFMRMASTFISVNAYGPLLGGTTYEHQVQVGFAGLELTDFSTPTPETLLKAFNQGIHGFSLVLWPYGADDSADPLVYVSGTLTSLSVEGDQPALVPEPGTILLVATGGLMGLIGRVHRRRKHRTHDAG